MKFCAPDEPRRSAGRVGTPLWTVHLNRSNQMSRSLTIGIIGYSTLPIMTAIHLLEKIQKFKTAIFVRFQELASSNDHHDERQAIHDALSTIRALKKETLSHPD
jgi:hypothetical protein